MLCIEMEALFMHVLFPLWVPGGLESEALQPEELVQKETVAWRRASSCCAHLNCTQVARTLLWKNNKQMKLKWLKQTGDRWITKRKDFERARYSFLWCCCLALMCLMTYFCHFMSTARSVLKQRQKEKLPDQTRTQIKGLITGNMFVIAEWNRQGVRRRGEGGSDRTIWAACTW